MFLEITRFKYLEYPKLYIDSNRATMLAKQQSNNSIRNSKRNHSKQNVILHDWSFIVCNQQNTF